MLIESRLVLLSGLVNGRSQTATNLWDLGLGKNSFGRKLLANGRKHHLHHWLGHEKTAGRFTSELNDHAKLLPTMREMILVRRWVIGVALVCLFGIIYGCSPRMDWREVQLQAIDGSALFPAKPVEVSRTLQMESGQGAITLTLRSARIDDTVFAVGWVLHAGTDTREKLEAAMLANIGAEAAMVSRQALKQDDRVIHEVTASGEMRLRPDSAPVPARLWMRSLTIHRAVPGQAGVKQVIEIIAAGPAHELKEEDARLFIESLKLAQ